MSLAGITVWVSRPAAQVRSLCQLIEEAGGRALAEPLLAIAEATDQAAQREKLEQAADWVLFTSRNAVERALALAPKAPDRWSKLACVGAATAASLREHGLEPALVPSEYSGAGLLAEPALAEVAGQRILIVTGQGGRRSLDEALRSRGAKLRRAEVYRRQALQIPQRRLRELLENSDVVVVTSGGALRHLSQLISKQLNQALPDLQLLLPSTRVAESAAALGYSRPPLIPRQMSNPSIVATLEAWAKVRRQAGD